MPDADLPAGHGPQVGALPVMATAAAAFAARLMAEPGCATLDVPLIRPQTAPVPGLSWRNLLLSAPRFRRAHVETFEVAGRLSVLHVCVFPHVDDASPIFGFDMVAGPARVTGIFLDLSPVTDAPPRPGLRSLCDPDDLAAFATRRTLPEWGDIFSPDMLAVRPGDFDEVRRAIALAHAALEGLLATPPRPACAVAGQARYIAGQRRNQHTERMLAGFVGAAAARRFIDEVLFPPPPFQIGATPTHAALGLVRA